MIRSDLEGVSGIVSYAQAEPGKPEYAFGLAMFRSDLSACLAGLLDGGAEEVLIYDEHFHGRNIDPAWLPDRVSVISGKPPYRDNWAGGLDETFAGLILLGFHAKNGTPGGLLPHSYEPDIRDLRLNGVSIGEIGMEAAVAGDFGVPVLLFTGDSAGAREAEALLAGVRTVAVKESLGASSGRCLPLNETAKMIQDAARQAAEAPTQAAPYRIAGGATLEIELNDGGYLEAVRTLFDSDMTDENTLRMEGPSAMAVWAEYWDRKLRAQDTTRAT